MNLIEQLGDYEKAKEWYDENTDKEWVGIYHMSKLYSEILEYRRENNIFEVGDKVVFVSEKMDFLDDDQIHSISVITENNLLKVCGIYVSFEVIRHVTDDEIKVGHRI